ncbi:VOC family protein [Lentzea sp. NPDC060358]|uniref:VOC family protein n=1 Tax=Lentzea sp. NPDC060358 TaxID=3347103 RepID=UPI00364601B5
MTATSSALPRRGVTGRHTERGVPHGVTSITPYVGVADVVAAARFYTEVFHARTVTLTRLGDLVIHAQLDFGHGHLHLEMPDPAGGGLSGPPPGGPDRTAFAHYCEDVEAVTGRAVAAGADQLGPVVEFPSGDRFTAVRDPHGVRWSITSRVADLSETESARRVAEWAARRADPAGTS